MQLHHIWTPNTTASWQAQQIEELSAKLEEANSSTWYLQKELESAQRFQSEQYSKLTLKMEYMERVHDPFRVPVVPSACRCI